MSQLIARSLAQIVNDNYKAAAVFEKYDLDFCCKGKRSLQQACDDKSVSLTEVLPALEALQNTRDTPVDFQRMKLSQITDYIVATHHAYVREQLPQVYGYLQRVAAKHGDRHPEMRKVFALFAQVKQELEDHMQKEELVVFPRVNDVERQLANKTFPGLTITYLQAPLEMMEAEHEQAGRILSEIRQLTNDYTAPADACTTYRLCLSSLQAFELDLHQHVHLENNVLFPRAIALLEPFTVRPAL